MVTKKSEWLDVVKHKQLPLWSYQCSRYQLSAFPLASHHDDVVSQHVEDGFNRLIQWREFNPQDRKVVKFSRFRKPPQRSKY